MMTLRDDLRPESQHDGYSLWCKKSPPTKRLPGILVHPPQNDLEKESSSAGDNYMQSLPTQVREQRLN